MDLDYNQQLIIKALEQSKKLSSKEVFEALESEISYATVKRILKELVNLQYVSIAGKGKATKYFLSPHFSIVYPIDMETYFNEEIDERIINERFNFNLLEELFPTLELFTENELTKLIDLQLIFKQKVADLESGEYNKELERLAIDLSWKSSQIEGNTYSLLETEQLLKEKKTAAGKTKDEATMLLNHKDAIDYVVEAKDYFDKLTVAKIEELHSILVKELPINRNLRKRKVGITGTNYSPLDNEFQIREALELSCKLINQRKNAFEKALLCLVLVSYIQPFVDGNKRTARILSNALLIQSETCPLSFRTVEAIDYKKAMLIFYEQNNISPMKQIFMDQFEFAVRTYF